MEQWVGTAWANGIGKKKWSLVIEQEERGESRRGSESCRAEGPRIPVSKIAKRHYAVHMTPLVFGL